MEARRLIAICLCWSLLVPVIPQPAEAGDRSKIVEVTPGQPAIWSLGQAHYLLANMHQRNRDLSTKLPNEDTLDPNRANSSRLEALRRALSFEAQFDESIGVKNDLEMQRFRNEQNRQEQARIQLAARRADLAELDRELLTLNEELVRLQEEDRQSTEARNATKPPPPPTPADNERKLRIEVLKVRKAQKEGEKARLESEITSLNTAATTNPTAPAFQTPGLTASSGGLPESAAFDKFVEDALADFSQPTLAASTALDNFVGMQYEIIAKQLTLLRDEVGPDERVIFLELPASIYSVDGRADDYVAQVEWEVTRYFDQIPPKRIREDVIKRDRAKGAPDQRNDESYGNDTGRGADYEEDQSHPITLDMIQMAAYEAEAMKSRPPSMHTQYEQELRGAEGRGVLEEYGFRSLRVRALDIIPRQSALNVNEYHATVKNTGLIGLLKLLSGFGAKVDFQNQREMYEQFIQQEVFASGYGKGSHIFGWTFGPQPGTRRVAPGQRTTYAVLAVPRDTLALELVPRTRVFRRHQSPRNAITGKPLVVRVPGAQTDGFWIDRISYAPVTKGRRVTVVLEGKYFSPQLGVMVNGVPLQKVVSITRAGSKEAIPASASGIQGEYELANSRQMVFSFGMGSDYTGTPIITLVTPDKSSALNFFRLGINNRRNGVSLQRLSAFEPMFLDDASVTSKLEVIEPFPVGARTFVATRLSGKGLRPSASVFVDNEPLREVDPLEAPGPGSIPTTVSEIQSRFGLRQDEPFFAQESVGSYILYFEQPQERCAVRYQQRTRQGLEEFNFEHVFRVPFSHKLRKYRRGFRGSPAEVALTITSRDATVTAISLDGLQTRNPAISGGCAAFERDGNINFRVRCFVPPLANRIERDFVTLKVTTTSGMRFVDIDLPVQPVVANVVNPRTGNASGFADEQPVIVISGINLHNVTAVVFGEQVVKLPASGAAESILVKVPKVEGIPRGQSIVVPVLFQTSTDGEAKIPSGAFYTFFGPPLEPNLIAWPCHPGAPCPQAVGGKP